MERVQVGTAGHRERLHRVSQAANVGLGDVHGHEHVAGGSDDGIAGLDGCVTKLRADELLPRLAATLPAICWTLGLVDEIRPDACQSLNEE